MSSLRAKMVPTFMVCSPTRLAMSKEQRSLSYCEFTADLMGRINILSVSSGNISLLMATPFWQSTIAAVQGADRIFHDQSLPIGETMKFRIFRLASITLLRSVSPTLIASELVVG